MKTELLSDKIYLLALLRQAVQVAEKIAVKEEPVSRVDQLEIIKGLLMIKNPISEKVFADTKDHEQPILTLLEESPFFGKVPPSPAFPEPMDPGDYWAGKPAVYSREQVTKLIRKAREDLLIYFIGSKHHGAEI